MKKKIKVNFSDFWTNFLKEDNFFYHALSLRYDVEISENPDILFFSVDYAKEGERFKYKDCLRIFYTGENVDPDWNECDLALTFRHNDKNPYEYRLPLWTLYLNWFNRRYNKERDQAYLINIPSLLNEKKLTNLERKFASFVASKAVGKRLEFVPKLSEYKMIDCAGSLFNNMGDALSSSRGDQVEKISFLSNYKFNIAIENSSSPGYCTEKILHSMTAGSIPIYWGSETVDQDFNHQSFVNWHDYGSDEKTIERIIEIDNNKKLYQEILNQPYFNDNKIPDQANPENLLSFLDRFL